MSEQVLCPCLFCKWAKEKKPEYQELIDENRLLNKPDNDGYLVVLDKYPKVAGHTLIISKEHYADITKINNDEFNYDIFFRGVNKWARRIKEELNKEFKEEKVKKIYVLSMCDHWSKKELLERGTTYNTEHLHFHLIPRYDFDKDIRGEKVLTRRASTGFEEITDVRKKIWNLLKDF